MPAGMWAVAKLESVLLHCTGRPPRTQRPEVCVRHPTPFRVFSTAVLLHTTWTGVKMGNSYAFYLPFS